MIRLFNVYQRIRRAMQLASDNSWAWRCLKHLSWRSQWIILCTLERRMPVSHEISPADWCTFGLSSWLSTRSSIFSMFSSLCTKHGLPLPGCQAVVPILQNADSLQQRIFPSFQPLSGRSLNSVHALYNFWQIKILHQNCIFWWSYLILTDIYVSILSQGIVAALNRWGGKIKTHVDGAVA